ncbi:MAG: hypothetical protein QOJ02_4184 [Acidobacteriota bacterium]|jgi:hypothetical protein|nr:hypothetical protein [Acidobacteriota bacterium]
MICSICKYGTRDRYCETCGNDTENQADSSATGVDHLVKAYDLVRYPQEDYTQSLNEFRLAIKHVNSFPSVLRMVTWFEYGMAMVKVMGGGPLKKLSTPYLHEFMEILKEVQQFYNRLSPEEKKALLLQNYDGAIRMNLGEANRVLHSRGTQEEPPKEVSTVSNASSVASKSGCLSLLFFALFLLASLALFSTVVW